jgi:hypothetical protein
VSGRQQNKTERDKCNVRDDSQQNCPRSESKEGYANPVVNHRLQKEDPNCIRITAEGNLIKYEEELLVRTADINTAKLHWNSVISTDDA